MVNNCGLDDVVIGLLSAGVSSWGSRRVRSGRPRPRRSRSSSSAGSTPSWRGGRSRTCTGWSGRTPSRSATRTGRALSEKLRIVKLRIVKFIED